MNEETVSPVRDHFAEARSKYYTLFHELNDLNACSSFVGTCYFKRIRELFNLLNREILDIIELYENKRKDNEGK